MRHSQSNSSQQTKIPIKQWSADSNPDQTAVSRQQQCVTPEQTSQQTARMHHPREIIHNTSCTDHRPGPSRCGIMGLFTLDLAVPIAHASFLPACMGWYNEHTWCLTSTETTRLIRDGDKGWGVWRWGKEGDHIAIAALSPPE